MKSSGMIDKQQEMKKILEGLKVYDPVERANITKVIIPCFREF